MGLVILPLNVRPFRLIAVRALALLFAALSVHVFAAALHAQEAVIQLDSAQTKIEFTLGDVLHTVHGTFALKSSAIRFDPSNGKISGTIIVDATSGESGNGSRDGKMHREILESDKFPEIVLTPSHMTGSLATQGPYQVEVSGRFRLHGVDHDVSIPVEVQPKGQHLRLKTHLIIPYVQWGLKNPSTFLLRVSDKVTIDIDAEGHAVQSEPLP